jgi:hypothetical protein
MFKLIVQDEEGCVIYSAGVHTVPVTEDDVADGRAVVTTVAGWIADAVDA